MSIQEISHLRSSAKMKTSPEDKKLDLRQKRRKSMRYGERLSGLRTELFTQNKKLKNLKNAIIIVYNLIVFYIVISV